MNVKLYETFSDTHRIKHLVKAGATATLCGLPLRVRLEDTKRRRTQACAACARRIREGDL